MAQAVQIGKIGLAIVYKSLPQASTSLTNVIGLVGEKYYQCNGTEWKEIVVPSGSLSITSNGTKDVTNYKEVSVNIPNQNPYIVATPDLMGDFLNSNYEDCYVKYVGTDEEMYEKNAVYQVYQYTQGNFDFREVVWTGDSNAIASDIANGKTAYVNGKKITGTNTNDSSYSTLLSETYPNAYSITYNLTGITANSSNPESISENSGVLLTFTPNTGYALPDSVVITNVTSYNWNKGTGKLAVSKPTGDVVITIVGVESQVSYNIEVTTRATTREPSPANTYTFYDGEEGTGTKVGEWENSNTTHTETFIITSGILTMYSTDTLYGNFEWGSTTGNVSMISNYRTDDDRYYAKFEVTGNGSVIGIGIR